MSKIYTVLGLMSGTSLDGVDAAIIETDGETIHTFGPALTCAYTASQRSVLDRATQAALTWNFDGPPPNIFAEAEDALDAAHRSATAALDIDGVDVIGYHGQTLLHRPDRYRTLQLGRGQSLATAFACPCIYDFRSADVAAGGQGAPLAPIYHKALVDHAGLSSVTAVLNLGGVGNVTLIDGDRLLASDTGPANGPLDSWLGGVDDSGTISREGVPDLARVETWLKANFFERAWPKSADRYDFDVLADMAGMNRTDGAATLAAFTALSVRKTVRQMQVRPDRVIVCGGGRHNRTIMTLLSLELGCPVLPAERFGWDSDAIEAQAFAYLAVRVLRGLPNSFPTTTGVPEPTVGGVIAYPQ
ncbi:anhydro-N-acetylmuramic acid kinase [Algimonas porphyrae]|uniref:Anhydro-N-acetylmuramic acid kinase n=1 Tax=Algimonas porphyrae TaxID=1128113 RepID=A0ABQ5UVF0_9PROT|nr:anhydro-N-acetylmuramic acid kinase [Algimonas porphyrae]GLQ19233.1 anhydro-N-acetylmuramic acid kinase [Algimonas porphyrae]